MQAGWWLNALVESTLILASRFPQHAPPLLLPHLPLLHPHDIAFTRPWLLGTVLMLAGSSLRLWCFRTLGPWFTWFLALKDDQQLITRGPYAVVRHPSYLGSSLLAIGTVLCTLGEGGWYAAAGGMDSTWGRVGAGAWAAVVCVVPAFLLTRLGQEDAVLRERFGEEWEAYARRTPYKLIPFVY